MDFSDAEHRYLHDVEFHTLVDTFYRTIERLHYTPGELREAVMFAAMLFELRHISPLRVNVGSEGYGLREGCE